MREATCFSVDFLLFIVAKNILAEREIMRIEIGAMEIPFGPWLLIRL